MEGKRTYSLGIDLNDQYAVVSYFGTGMAEPETVSLVAGGEAYRIPMLVAKRAGAAQWYYGEDVRKMANGGDIIYVDRLLSRAVNQDIITIDGEQFEAEQLLQLYLQKLMLLPMRLGSPGYLDVLVLTVEKLTREYIEMFRRIAAHLQIPETQFMMLDHKQVFFYFTLSQPKDLWLHDVYLFEYEGERLHDYVFSRNMNTKPQIVSIEEGANTTLPEDKDHGFLALLKRTFANQIISTVYLVGDGFDGNWLRESVNFLCRTRRAFIGRNLFSKGACFAAQMARQDDLGYVYLGENDMQFNVSLKVQRGGRPAFYNLVSAGKNWFEAQGSCEVLLNGESGVSFWKQPPYAAAAEIETLELTDLPERPPRTTRLRITAEPMATDRLLITIRDLGFGEFYRSSEKKWSYTMTI